MAQRLGGTDHADSTRHAGHASGRQTSKTAPEPARERCPNRKGHLPVPHLVERREAETTPDLLWTLLVLTCGYSSIGAPFLQVTEF